MHSALVDTAIVDYSRVDVYQDTWDKVLTKFKSGGLSADVTLRRSVWGPRDTTTGWLNQNFLESTVEMIILQRGSQFFNLVPGTYVRTDALGLTGDVVNVADEVKDASNNYWEVKAVREKWFLDNFEFREVDLVKLPLHT